MSFAYYSMSASGQATPTKQVLRLVWGVLLSVVVSFLAEAMHRAAAQQGIAIARLTTEVQERRKVGMATLTDELETETVALGAALQEIGAAAARSTRRT